MSIDKAELLKRTEAARAAIKAVYGTKGDEYDATLFVSHHLEVIEPAYWEEWFKTPVPEADQILDALVLRSGFDDEDEPDSLDFTLPGDVTDYVLCVSFDEAGEVTAVAMES